MKTVKELSNVEQISKRCRSFSADGKLGCRFEEICLDAAGMHGYNGMMGAIYDTLPIQARQALLTSIDASDNPRVSFNEMPWERRNCLTQRLRRLRNLLNLVFDDIEKAEQELIDRGGKQHVHG